MQRFTWVLKWRLLIFALLTTLLSLQIISPTSAQENKPERGEAAIGRLGNRLKDVAARYGMSVNELAKTFRTDKNLWLDKQDNLLFADEFVTQNAGTAAADTNPIAAAGPVAYDQTFLLESLPSASKVIYLDFNGHTTSGTPWNSNYTGNVDIVSAPFHFEGDATTNFTNAELDRIQYIWQRVAEDYAPFGVNVTTKDPGVDGLRNTGGGDANWGVRVVISPTSWYQTYQGTAVGGIAYIGTYNWASDLPCFAFTAALGPNSEKSIAEAVSHEVGHTLNLNHDGTATAGYYEGHNGWAPIMGVGYNQALSQWSKGQYTGASNTEDDLTKIVYATNAYSRTNGFSYRADDHGNDRASATALTMSGTAATGKGIISRIFNAAAADGAGTKDVDYFSFQTAAGNVTFTISCGPRDANLDTQAKLFDANGTQLLVSNSTTSLGATIATTLAAGTYYISVEGVGKGDLATGYSDYGSLGEFNISGTVAAAAANQAPTAQASGTPTSGVAPLTVSFSSAGSADSDGSISGYSWTFGNGGKATTASASTVYTAPGVYDATLTVTDNGGLTNTKTVTITVAPSAPTNLVATALSSTEINLTWADNSSNETGFKIERSLNNSTWTAIAITAANVTTYKNSNLTEGTTYYYRVRSISGGVESANATANATTPTSAAAASTMHLGDLDFSKSIARNGTWSAMVTMKVEKEAHGALASAIIAGTWSNAPTTTVTCKANTKGVCSITKSGLPSTTTSITFTVTGVTLSGYSYVAGSSHDPDTGLSGTVTTSTTVNK